MLTAMFWGGTFVAGRIVMQDAGAYSGAALVIGGVYLTNKKQTHA